MPLGTFDRCHAAHAYVPLVDKRKLTLVLTLFLLTHLEIAVSLNVTQELKAIDWLNAPNLSPLVLNAAT